MKNSQIVQSNALIQKISAQGGQSVVLTVPQRRIVLTLLAEITKETDTFAVYENSYLNYCRDWQISRGGNQFETTRRAIESLVSNVYSVGNVAVRWLAPESCIADGTIHIKLDDSLQAYLLGLSGGFTRYNLETVLNYKSKHSFRIYELLKSFESQQHYRMRIEDAYARIGDGNYQTPSALKNHVLTPAISEINATSDICILYRFERTYSTVTHILFQIRKNKVHKNTTGTSYKTPRVSSNTELAKSIDIVQFLLDMHPELITKYKGQYCNPQHKSIKFNKNLYYRFSKGEYGDIIEYLKKFGGYSDINDVRKELEMYCGANTSLKSNCSTTTDIQDTTKIVDDTSYNPPINCNANTAHIINYLRQRCIPDDIINRFIDEGMLYADSRCNCVFSNAEPGKGVCMVKGTGTVPFNKIIAENPNGYWHFAEGHNPNKIYVFESPIDAVSFYEWNFRQNGIYVAMGGLKKNTLKKIEEDFNADGTKTIELCVDWDAAGTDFVHTTMGDKYPHRLPQDTTDTKDWNEILCAQKVKQRPSVCIDIYRDDDDEDDCDFVPF